MATTKITITLQDDQVEEIRALVAAGRAANVSVRAACRSSRSFDAAGWREMLEEALLAIVDAWRCRPQIECR